MKKIDVHVHLIGAICGFGAEGELRALGDGMVEYASGKQFRLIPKGYGDKEVTAETLLSVMDDTRWLMQSAFKEITSDFKISTRMRLPVNIRIA